MFLIRQLLLRSTDCLDSLPLPTPSATGMSTTVLFQSNQLATATELPEGRSLHPKHGPTEAETVEKRSRYRLIRLEGRTFLYSLCLCFVCIIWTRPGRPRERNTPLTVPPVGLVRYVPQVPPETEGVV